MAGRADSATVTITGPDQVTYTSAVPVELKAIFARTSSFMLTIQGNSGRGGWSATAMLTQAQALGGHANLHVSTAPIGEGIANITHVAAEGTREQASAGVLEFAVTKGRISGTVSAAPAKLGASVSGDSSVSCWVPASLLGAAKDGAAPQGTVGTSGNDEVLVEDVELSSPPCSALKAWRRG